MGELSMKMLRGFVINTCGRLSGIKSAEILRLIVEGNHAYPESSFAIKVNSLEPARTLPPPSLIAPILSRCAFPEILASIAKRISVPVVSFFFALAIKKLPMHIDFSTGSVSTDSVESFNARIPRSAPIELRHQCEVFSVNGRVLSLGKCDIAIRWIKRLSDCMAFHAALGHRSTSNGSLQLSRYFTTPEFIKEAM
jgi:hypothetical protein